MTSDVIVGLTCVNDGTTDSTKLPLAGGTLTGTLTLAGDPVNPLEAATRGYVDAAVNGVVSSQWSSATGGINYAGGNVGIGTATPASRLDINANHDFTADSYKSAVQTSLSGVGSSASMTGYYTEITGGGDLVGQYNTVVPLANSANSYGVYNDIARGTGTFPGGRMYGVYSYLGNNSNFSSSNYMYGTYNQVAKNNNASARSDVYGTYNLVYNSGGTGVNETYGTYSDVTADADGDSSAYGSTVYVSGADTNYLYHGVGTAGTGRTLYGVYVDVGIGAGTEYAGIFLNGNVGIGTTTPSAPLNVKKDINGAAQIRIDNNDTSQWSNSQLLLATNSGNGNGTLGAYSTFATPTGLHMGASVFLESSANMSNGLLLNTAGSAPIRFATNNSERMRINSAGNVGIGTTTPASKLTVAGTIESTIGGVKFPDGTVQTTAAGMGSFQKGTIGSCTASSTGTTGSVTFPTAFAGTPIVQMTVVELDNNGCTSASITAISATGFSWSSWVGGTLTACDCIYWTAFY